MVSYTAPFHPYPHNYHENSHEDSHKDSHENLFNYVGGLLSVALAVALRAQPLAGILPLRARTFLRDISPRDQIPLTAGENCSIS